MAFRYTTDPVGKCLNEALKQRTIPGIKKVYSVKLEDESELVFYEIPNSGAMAVIENVGKGNLIFILSEDPKPIRGGIEAKTGVNLIHHGRV